MSSQTVSVSLKEYCYLEPFFLEKEKKHYVSELFYLH